MKNQTQHTPGLWTPGLYVVEDQVQVPHVLIRSGMKCIAMATYGENDELLANARLIAAAPELLAALERAEKQLAIAFNPGGDDRILTLCRTEAQWSCNQARAAIAKATGDNQ